MGQNKRRERSEAYRQARQVEAVRDMATNNIEDYEFRKLVHKGVVRLVRSPRELESITA